MLYADRIFWSHMYFIRQNINSKHFLKLAYVLVFNIDNFTVFCKRKLFSVLSVNFPQQNNKKKTRRKNLLKLAENKTREETGRWFLNKIDLKRRILFTTEWQIENLMT